MNNFFPPRELLESTSGFPTDEYEYYQRSLVNARFLLNEIATASPWLFTNHSLILDFGCGVGRVSKAFTQICDCQIHGTDYSEQHIDFARRFTSAQLTFHQNAKLPPLQFDCESFDAIFSLSVFTHFNHQTFVCWANEMHRLLKPGGIFAVTLRGRAYNTELSITERNSLENEGYCIRNEDSECQNSCNSFFSPECIRAAFAKFETVAFHESPHEVSPREKLNYQDLWVFRKPYAQSQIPHD